MDGELPGVEQMMVRDHITCCESCREDYESLLFTKRLLCGLKVKQPSESLESRVRDRIAEEGNSGRPDSAGAKVRSGLAGWWQLLAYGQKLRFSAIFAAASVAIAVITIAPRALRPVDDETELRPPVTFTGSSAAVERYMIQPGIDGRFRSIVPTYHDPSTNPPSASGAPLLIPVSADEVGAGRR
jgi:hypothetical protein